MQRGAENRVKELAEQNEQLKRIIKELDDKIKELHLQINNMKGKEDTMKEKIERYEVSYKTRPITSVVFFLFVIGWVHCTKIKDER